MNRLISEGWQPSDHCDLDAAWPSDLVNSQLAGCHCFIPHVAQSLRCGATLGCASAEVALLAALPARRQSRHDQCFIAASPPLTCHTACIIARCCKQVLQKEESASQQFFCYELRVGPVRLKNLNTTTPFPAAVERWRPLQHQRSSGVHCSTSGAPAPVAAPTELIVPACSIASS